MNTHASRRCNRCRRGNRTSHSHSRGSTSGRHTSWRISALLLGRRVDCGFSLSPKALHRSGYPVGCPKRCLYSLGCRSCPSLRGNTSGKPEIAVALLVSACHRNITPLHEQTEFDRQDRLGLERPAPTTLTGKLCLLVAAAARLNLP